MGVVRDVLTLPDVRRLEFGWGCSVVAELAGTIALSVYAYREGGAALVGVYGLARTLPAAVAAPMVMGLSDRVRRERLLLACTTLRLLSLLAAAAIAAAAGPAMLVIIFAAVASMLAGTYRPLLVTILPWLARTPGELAAVNVVATSMESSGALIGPVLSAVVLSVADPWVVIAAAAGFVAVGALGLARVALPPDPGEQHPSSGGLLLDAGRGLVEIARVAPPAGMAVLLFAQTLLRGALSVLLVVLAVDVLGEGESLVGWLYAAMGVGGLAGGAAAAAVVRANRLGRCFVVGLLLWGLPLALLAPAPSLIGCLAALAAVGGGNAVQDVGAATLTPRLFSPRVLGRVLGAEELIVFAGGGAGAVAAAPLIGALGVRGTLAVLGLGMVTLVGLYTVRFVQIDRELPAAAPGAELMQGLPMFAPLSLAVVELLATRLVAREYPAGAAVMTEGQHADGFELVVAGSAAVTVRGIARRTLGAGDGFGEIALLRDSPRTATVTATEPLHTLALHRDDFLAAVTGHPSSVASAEELASSRLAADPPIEP